MPSRLSPELLARIEDRIRKAARFRDAGDAALQSGDYETAVSRAYYAAYHGAVAFLMDNNKPEAETWRTHTQVISECIRIGTRRTNWLREIRLLPRIDFAESFNTLYDWREQADYSPQIPSREKARRARDFVKDFLIEVNDRIPIA